MTEKLNHAFGIANGWVGPGIGTVKDNEYVPGRKAVAGGAGTLHLYAAFMDDADQDDARTSCDCNDADSSLWAPPGAIDDLQLSHNLGTGVTTLFWTEPAFPGGTSVRYDTIRSDDPSDFATGVTCVESDDAADTDSSDSAAPDSGAIFYYIVHPDNDCAPDSFTCRPPATFRTARTCP